jgi:hypothetical protein
MNRAGEQAEAAFIHHAHRHIEDIEVFLPTSHRTKVDVALCKPGSKLVKVQIKKATNQKLNNGNPGKSYKFLVGSSQGGATIDRVQKYKKGMFDILAVYIMEHNAWAFYRLEDIEGTTTKRWSINMGPMNNWDLLKSYL